MPLGLIKHALGIILLSAVTSQDSTPDLGLFCSIFLVAGSLTPCQWDLNVLWAVMA